MLNHSLIVDSASVYHSDWQAIELDIMQVQLRRYAIAEGNRYYAHRVYGNESPDYILSGRPLNEKSTEVYVLTDGRTYPVEYRLNRRKPNEAQLKHKRWIATVYITPVR